MWNTVSTSRTVHCRKQYSTKQHVKTCEYSASHTLLFLQESSFIFLWGYGVEETNTADRAHRFKSSLAFRVRKAHHQSSRCSKHLGTGIWDEGRWKNRAPGDKDLCACTAHQEHARTAQRLWGPRATECRREGRELALVKLSTDISSRANMQLDLWRKLSVIVTSVSQPKRYMQ